MIRTMVPLAALALAGAAAAASVDRRASGEESLAKMLVGRVAGAPVSCIPLHEIQDSHVVDGTAIVYEGYGSRLYVNRPASGAESLSDDDILITRSPTDQLCSIDIVRLVDRYTRFEHGFVGLGKFIPYDRPKQPH